MQCVADDALRQKAELSHTKRLATTLCDALRRSATLCDALRRSAALCDARRFSATAWIHLEKHLLMSDEHKLYITVCKVT